MSRVIRIGTRDSQLALWQAKTVQSQIEAFGHKTVLVPVKSTGDIVLDKPLYELGITGIFTKTLDIAILNEDIDIAVHSLKDVPTVLPKGIVQAAVLKRGNVSDTLVFKNNEEFLSAKNAIIATGSLRRKAQWLNRYPTHEVVGLRGNVNSRLQKLEENNWNGAIFAAAGIGRLGLTPKNSVKLDWMIPAPAQGAVMVAALERDDEILSICTEINDEETEICTSIERKFLNLLEGGCTAPIGALAKIRNEEVQFKGILLSKDGTKKIEVSRTKPLGKHHDIAEFCSEFIINRGGKTLIDQTQRKDKDPNIYSTKRLTQDQLGLFHNEVTAISNDAIQISLNRIQKSVVNGSLDHVIITSKNAVESLLHNFDPSELDFKNIYCVGRRTKRLVKSKIGAVSHTEPNAKALAAYLTDQIKEGEVTYFCSDLRLDTIPDNLNKAGIEVIEVIAYQTKYNATKLGHEVEGVMFYSPSTVNSFMKANKAKGTAFCIGETTASAARQHFENVEVAKVPTVESVIELVNMHFVQ
ncbi:MAG: hydroxymethylbilane synthase [Bacteroidota bacterium]